MANLSHFKTLTLLSVIVMGVGCSKSSDRAATSNQSSSRPKLTNVYQVGPTIDVLKTLDLQRDVVRGDFRWEDGDLVFSGQQAQANLPIVVPEQYELLMTVERTNGTESLNLGFHIGGVTTSVVIEGWQRRISALNLVDGKIGLNNETRTEFPVFKDSRPKAIRIIVRRESILVDVDGGVFIDYRDSPSRLSFDERYFQRPRRDQIMIAGWNSTFRVSSWVLKPFGDRPVRYTENKPDDPAPRDLGAIIAQAKTGTSGANGPDTAAVADPTSGESSRDVSPSSRDVAATAPVESEEPSGDPPDEDPPTELPAGTPWQAVPDPSRWATGDLTSHQTRIEMRSGVALIPLRRSPFFCIIQSDDDRSTFQLHDLRKAAPVGEELTLRTDRRRDYQLAESGQYLLSHVDFAEATKLEVHSFVTGKLVFSLESPDVRIWDYPRDHLLPDHRLLSFRDVEDALTATLYDLETGDAIASWDSGLDKGDGDALAVTPGGRFSLTLSERRLYVHELATGDLVGKLPLPEQVDGLIGMAFNSVATELAMVATYDEKPSSLLWCLDWRTGETTSLADTGFKLDSLHNVYELGPALEWVPGDQLLLFYGRDLIDRQTGRFFYRIPENVYWQMPRRALSPTTLLAMMRSEDPDFREYRRVALDRKAMSDSLRVIRGGGIAADIGLPPLTVANSAAGRTIEATSDQGSVSTGPQPRATLQENVIDLPIPLVRLKEIRGEVRRFQMADPAAAVGVAHIYDKAVYERESRQLIARYDLQRGKQTSVLPIREDFRLIDVTPDGSRALLGMVNDVHAFSRLDVVDLIGETHVAGWRPYADQPFVRNVDSRGQPAPLDPQTASWVRFVDNDHVVSVNPAGRLVVWAVPSCEAVLTFPEFGKPLDQSDDRRYIAGTRGSSVALLDVQQGAHVGQLVAEETPLSVQRAVFDPKGTELAAVLGYQGRSVMVFWNLADGRVVEQFELNYGTASPGWFPYAHPYHRRIGLEYKRDGFLLMDDLYLINRKARTTAWSYHLRMGRHVVGELDDREWFVQQVSGSNRGGQYWDWMLTALPIPSDEVITASSTVAPGQRPTGMSVLRLEGEEVKAE